MTCSPMTEVFCDWLDVTFSSSDCPSPELNRFLLDAGFHSPPSGRYGHTAYTSPFPHRGKIHVDQNSRWSRVSASGGSCAALRASGHWLEYLSLLSMSPHRVTRLDASYDRPVDGAVTLRELRSRYPAGTASLGRKSLAVTLMLSTRPDGLESGTWYLGHRSRARITAKVYDKALEALERRGELLLPTTRYEITATHGSGVTLRDAALPEAFFWSAASPALLQAPEGVVMWQSSNDIGWSVPPRKFDPYALLSRRVAALPDLDALAMLADDLGPNGRTALLRLIEQRLAGSVSVSSVSTSDPAAAA